MRPVARTGDSVVTGHLCTTVTTIGPAISSVVSIGRPTSVAGTMTVVHTIKVGDKCIPHALPTGSTGTTVFVSGRPINKVGDPADLGTIISGASNVFSV